jgi:hypothetical protein
LLEFQRYVVDFTYLGARFACEDLKKPLERVCFERREHLDLKFLVYQLLYHVVNDL